MAGLADAASEIADSVGRAALNPEDGVWVLRLQQKLQVGRNVGGTLAQARGLVDAFQALQFALEARERVQRSGVRVAAFFQKLGALVDGHGGAGRAAGR